MVAGQISRGQNFVAADIPQSVEDPAELGSETDFTGGASQSTPAMRGLDRTLFGASIGSDRIACPTIRGLTNSKQGDHDESDETGVDGNTVLAWVESSATARRLEVDARFQEFSWHCVVPGIPWRDGRAVCART